MVSERWKQIEQVYDSVVASPRAGRAALLDELCAGDLDMHREVESLLDAREQAGDFLSSVSLRDHVAELLSEQDLVGQTLGHYHILSVIGAGAMGDVYLARDTKLDRQIAFKILPPRFTQDSGRVARFPLARLCITQNTLGDRSGTVPVDGGREEPSLELERFDQISRSWGVIDSGISISRQDAPYQTIRFFSFATRQTTSLATLDKEPIGDCPDVALSNDGRLLLVACVDEEVNDLMLIENFH